jgi:hypothetical protein
MRGLSAIDLRKNFLQGLAKKMKIPLPSPAQYGILIRVKITLNLAE